MLFQLLAQKASERPTKPAVVGERRTLTYGQLYREAANTAAYLQSLELASGQPIILGMPPCPEFHVAFFGVSALGLPSIAVLPSGKISSHVIRAEPAVAIGDDAFLAAASERCPSLRHSIRWRREEGLEIPSSDRPFTRTEVYRHENIFAVSSSGTTGEPKLYFRSAEMVVERSDLRANAHGITPDDVLLATRPYNNSVAINNQVVIPVLTGSSIVALESFERFKIAEAIATNRVTVLLAAPFFYELLASIPQIHHCDFSSVRLCVAGGAPLGFRVRQAFQDRFGLVIHQWYAGSHIHPVFLHDVDGPPDAVGRIEGLFPARILGDNNETLGPGMVGEIVFHLPSIPDKWRSSLERNPNRRGDYLHTGDLGRTDTAGYIYVVGRKSAIIKVGGNRVEPAEVEDVLRRHPRVREALVFGSRSGEADELVQAIVEASEEVHETELLKHCAQHLDPYKCPRRITIKASLPRTEQGKLSRQLLDSLICHLLAGPSIGWLGLLSAVVAL
jgi:long-chain acyl-CoA synthetase